MAVQRKSSTSGPKCVRSVPLSDAKLTELLDRLDEEDWVSPGRGRQQRARYPYRLKELVVTLHQPGGTMQSVLVPTRNISATGFAFLHGGYVHVGTRCAVQLITSRNTRQMLQGRVVRCKHTVGRVHAIGIQFDREIDVTVFAQEAMEYRVLVVDDDPSMCRLISYYLKELNAEVTVVGDGDAAVKEAMEKPYDLILLDLDLPGLDGMSALELLRSKGYQGMVAALTGQACEEVRERCRSAGFDGYQEKPISKESLAELLGNLAGEPLCSSLTGGPEVDQLIAEFVEELAEKVRDLEGALAKQDLEMVQRLARSLRGEAGSYGFAPIAERAEKLNEACGAGAEVEAIAGEARELVALCRRARGPISPGGSGEAGSGAKGEQAGGRRPETKPQRGANGGPEVKGG